MYFNVYVNEYVTRHEQVPPDLHLVMLNKFHKKPRSMITKPQNRLAEMYMPDKVLIRHLVMAQIKSSGRFSVKL